MLERLEVRGLVTRRQDAQDLRGVRVALTSSGSELYETISVGHDHMVAELISTALDPDEVRMLMRLSERVHRYSLSLRR